MSGPRQIVQLLAGFAEGDAISQEARSLHAAFQRLGFASAIVVVDGHIAPSVATACTPLSAFRAETCAALVYHYGVASPATPVYQASRVPRVLVYHNITPAAFFRGFDDGLVSRLDLARAELQSLAAISNAVWADSAYNAQELTAGGAQPVRVVPLIYAPEDMTQPADASVLARFAAPLTNILCVGRLAPNKCIEELIQAFGWYQRAINPWSRLIIAGSNRSAPRYQAMLRMLAAELDVPNICFEGFVSPGGLAALYQLATVFVSTSRHEGYCLPLVEAMHRGVPVISRHVGGTPEALGQAGVLFDDLNAPELAQLIHRVVTDGTLRSTILASQQQRLQALAARPVDRELRELLTAAGITRQS